MSLAQSTHSSRFVQSILIPLLQCNPRNLLTFWHKLSNSITSQTTPWWSFNNFLMIFPIVSYLVLSNSAGKLQTANSLKAEFVLIAGVATQWGLTINCHPGLISLSYFLLGPAGRGDEKMGRETWGDKGESWWAALGLITFHYVICGGAQFSSLVVPTCVG